MQVKGSIVQGSPVPVHGGRANEKTRHFCPLPPARQQWEVGMLSPHCFGAGSSSSSYPVPAGLQGQVGQKAAPTFLQAASQPREKARTDTAACYSIARVPQWPWGAEKTLPGQPHAPPHCYARPRQPPIPTTARGRRAGPEQQKNSSFTFIKNTVPLLPLDPISYLLTVVKYYCSSPPNQAGFPLSTRYPLLFFIS